MQINDDLRNCFTKVQVYLNHLSDSVCVEFYLDPRILASWCYQNKITNTNIKSETYFGNREWELVMNNMELYKDYVF